MVTKNIEFLEVPLIIFIILLILFIIFVVQIYVVLFEY